MPERNRSGCGAARVSTANTFDGHGHHHRHSARHAGQEPPVRRRLPRHQLRREGGGGYYAYVSSKFANELLVVIPIQTATAARRMPQIPGRVLLTAAKGTKSDDVVTGNAGHGWAAFFRSRSSTTDGPRMSPTPLSSRPDLRTAPPARQRQLRLGSAPRGRQPTAATPGFASPLEGAGSPGASQPGSRGSGRDAVPSPAQLVSSNNLLPPPTCAR